ncbi:hypothetical protein D9758_004836 [Tetrapyrgos nigripes]|uniref:GH18 domain-containing protein n=1 Tax=Tetrapyrgos nigripes TaxID=182062 RepID=A0A8H5G5U9_9AGAR|nr:hypothetical protein D9758_004836 [Tetrapyrgos nigripes]
MGPIPSIPSIPSIRFIAAKVASGYFPGWHAANATPAFDISDISWDKYTKLVFAFARINSETAEDGGLTICQKFNPQLLAPFVEAAKSNNVAASVSIGGWEGSRFFSSLVGSAENQTKFVKTVTDFAVQYDLDGVDLDWEYPNRQGLGCNVVNANDTTNFLEFLKEFKADPVGAQLLVSAAVSITPFVAADSSASTDVSEFAQYLDYITIMNYDIWGPWSSSVGPNAPLDDTCAAPANQQGSAVFAVQKWTEAGFPADQILLGIPAYGRSFSVSKTSAYVNGTTELAAYPPFNSTTHPIGDSWDIDGGTVDPCGTINPNGGHWRFWALIEAGLLDECGKNVSGVPFRFDDCSKTAYLYHPDEEIEISFDNTDTWAAKGQFISDKGLAGFNVWETGGDYNDLLLDAVRSTAGFN